RGVVFDIDPEFNNTEEWYQSIPAEIRPRKDQPFYHLFAENAESEYIAYVSEQNLLPDTSGEPVRHPQVAEVFEQDEKGSYRPRHSLLNGRRGAVEAARCRPARARARFFRCCASTLGSVADTARAAYFGCCCSSSLGSMGGPS